ncbi:hypothetical protein HY632_03335 [Candidatus Uhrbacteria bacterium]|nr:hypothetical protein [Candidatus Uhrbacteria bacterium]
MHQTLAHVHDLLCHLDISGALHNQLLLNVAEALIGLEFMEDGVLAPYGITFRGSERAPSPKFLAQQCTITRSACRAGVQIQTHFRMDFATSVATATLICRPDAAQGPDFIRIMCTARHAQPISARVPYPATPYSTWTVRCPRQPTSARVTPITYALFQKIAADFRRTLPRHAWDVRVSTLMTRIASTFASLDAR